MKWFKVIDENLKIYYKSFFTYREKWAENEDKFEKLLKCEIQGNLQINTGALYLNHVPEHLKDQFTKKGRAKVNSDIAKKYLELVKELGLEEKHTSSLAFKIDASLLFGGQSQYHWLRKVDECVIETSLEQLSCNKLKEISEKEWLEMKLADLNKRNNADIQVNDEK